MQLTPENFVDGIKSIQFEYKGQLWHIGYSEKMPVGNGLNYLNPKVLHGPADKINSSPSKVMRHFTEDRVTITYS